MWLALRAKRFQGVKFTRQVVIGRYIADFAARSRRLVIEVDGDSHAGQASYDAERTAWLEEQGYQVIRFTNAEVGANLEGVLSAIDAALAAPPLSQPSPQGGEG
ncbi:endonuclease domain-containing protein [Sphingomonas sp. CJ99]